MSPFLQERNLFVTPLSPIHIGNGLDIDPTDYVIEGDFLYGFNPADGVLNSKQREELGLLARQGDLLAIQRFFRKYASHFLPFAQMIAAVCPGFKKEYDNHLGQVRQNNEAGNQIYNQFFVSRHTTTGVAHQPYIPGSSLKGSVRTAWLDIVLTQALHSLPVHRRNARVRRNEQLDSALGLDINFAKNPFRLFKVSDVMPTRELLTEILYSIVWYQEKALERRQNSGISNRLECLTAGQYRGLHASVSLPAIPADKAALASRDKKNKLQVPEKYFLDAQGRFELELLAKRCNAFYGNLLLAELDYLQSAAGQGQATWCRTVRALLFNPDSELRKKLAQGQAFLVRIGSQVGRDSITFNDELRAHVTIDRESDQKMEALRESPKTKTLAAAYSNAESDFLPFGWAVVEIDPIEDCKALEQWCAQIEFAGYKVNQLADIVQQKKEQFKVRRRDLRAQIAQQEQVEQKARIEAKKRAEEERLKAEKKAKLEAQRLSSMTENERKIEGIRKACEEWAAQLPPHGNFKKQSTNPGEVGIYQDTNRLVKEALEDESWTAEERQLLANTIEEWLPQVVGPWNARSERRRLKINQLRQK